MTSKVDFGRPSAQPKFLQFPNTNLSDFSQFSRVLGKSNIKFAKSVSCGLGKPQCRKRSHFFIVKNSTPKIILRQKWNLCRTPLTMDLPEARSQFYSPFFCQMESRSQACWRFALTSKFQFYRKQRRRPFLFKRHFPFPGGCVFCVRFILRYRLDTDLRSPFERYTSEVTLLS